MLELVKEFNSNYKTMNTSLLVVFNLYDNPSKNNLDKWKKNILQLSNQNNINYDLVISANSLRPHMANSLQEFLENTHFKSNNVFINITQDKIPVNATFNHTCIKTKSVTEIDYDGYLYCASDIFVPNENVFSDMYRSHITHNSAITSGMVNNDHGLNDWFRGEERTIVKDLREKDFIVPIGKTFNLHFAIFDKNILQEYSKLIPDIFASHCTESVFYYLCCSLNKKLVICNTKTFLLLHEGLMDGRSVCFRDCDSRNAWKHLFKSKRTIEQRLMQNEEAISSGIGYEEVRNIMPHNKDMYDENGNHTNPDLLKKVIRDNLYLSQEELNYDDISYKLIQIKG